MSEYADLILLSNCIFTATEEIPFSGYIAIKNDRILSIGKGLAPTELIGTNTKYLDYGNKTITPGFSDVHCFFTGYSVGFVGIDLSAATSQEDILNSIKEYAKGIPADKPILGHGWNSDTIQPDGTDLLDEAFSTRPVLLFAKGCETCWMNQVAINRHSITDLEFSDPTDLERMGKLGVIAEIYPQIQSIANRKDKLAMIEEKIGMDRGQYYWNRRKMADSNVLLSCGTDLPLLIDDIPESIYHAVGGYFPEGGEPFNKQNMLTIPELLTAQSAGDAYNLYQEKELGTLEKGKKADIVVFDGNLFETAIEEIRSRKVEVTFLNGRIVYSHE